MVTAWGEPQLWASNGVVWRAILGQAREVVGATLRNRGIKYDIAEFRWDVPDLTFSWPERPTASQMQEQYHNIHCWVEGSWPSYSLHIEAAMWRDENSERRIVFVPSTSLRVTVSGTPEEPSVAGIKNLQNSVRRMADDVSGARIEEGQVFPLEASPEPEQG